MHEQLFRKLSDGTPVLIGSKCNACGFISFPKKKVCPNCYSHPQEEVLIGRKGKIKSYTISYVAPQGFQAPYVQSFVQIEEGPTVFALIEIDLETATSLQIGQPVSLITSFIGQDMHGNKILSYKYSPQKETEVHERC